MFLYFYPRSYSKFRCMWVFFLHPSYTFSKTTIICHSKTSRQYMKASRYFKVKCDAKIKWCSIIEILTNLEKASSHYLTFISNRPWVLREEGVHSLALFKVELIVWAHFFHRLIICPNCQMYFFKLYSVFVQIVKIYFFKFPKLFV